MKNEITERKNIQSMPTYLILNKYVHEISRNKRSNNDIVVHENNIVERKPLLSYMGNTVDIYV